MSFDIKFTRLLPGKLDIKRHSPSILYFYYIPINDTSFELSVFWLSDTESQINELMFSDSVSLSFKMRLTSVTCFWGALRKVNFKHGTRD